MGEVREDHSKRLFIRALAGDAVAYHAFLKDLSGHLRAFYRKRLTGLPDEVEDLVQEALLAIHNQRHTYDARLPLSAWVHAIAKYKMVNLLRRRAVRDALNDPLDEELALFATSDADAVGGRMDVDSLLARLPQRQRELIVHMKLAGLSVTETSQMTGISPSAVKVGVHRGLKALAAMVRAQR